MNFPCPIAIHCPDNPFANLSSEGVEVWTAVGYCCDSSLRQGFSALSQGDAFLATAQLMRETCPDCRGLPQEFCADADCPDGSNLTKICVPSSQADADALAAAAAAAMLPFCDTKDQLFEANCTCPDGITDPHTTRSNISQEIADAECAVIPKTCPGIPTAGATCTVFCPDGSPFTYTLPPGTVTAPTQAEADELAHQLACERAKELIFCLEPIAPCACVGVHYTALIRLSYGTRPVTFAIVSGALPSTFTFGQTSNGFLFGGIPVITGNYAFEIRATDADGNFVQKQYFLNVIGITTTTVPDYTVGTPYSFQLTASGGSANYSWTIQSGSLPDGLTLSRSGLISGTPTGLDPGTPVTFDVVDVTCQQVQESHFPPRVSLSTVSRTTVATRHGFRAFDGSDVLYRNVTYTGEAEQICYVRFPDSEAAFFWVDSFPHIPRWYIGRDIPTYPTVNFCTAIRCGQAKYIWNGTTSINEAGVIVATHRKDRYGLCQNISNDVGFYIYAGFFNELGEPVFVPSFYGIDGYCWEPDPLSCDPCPDDDSGNPDLEYRGNWAQPTTLDGPSSFTQWGTAAITQTTLHKTGSPDPLSSPWTAPRRLIDDISGGVKRDTQLPMTPSVFFDWDNPQWAVVEIQGTQDWTATLSSEYTYADAFANAQFYVSNGRIAGTQVDYLRWGGSIGVHHVQSKFTTVNFTLHCTNLSIGREYIVSYQFKNTVTNITSTITERFTAVDTVHDVIGTIPTPLNNQFIKIQNPTIAFH